MKRKKYKLKKRQGKLYALFCQHLDTGILYGYCECSFSMDWQPNWVRIYDDIGHVLQHRELFKDLPERHYFIARVGSKKAPKIQLRGRWSTKDKYRYRNRPFKDLEKTPTE